jgi:hypothetical protein
MQDKAGDAVERCGIAGWGRGIAGWGRRDRDAVRRPFSGIAGSAPPKVY